MTPRISSVHPPCAVEGGRVSIRGESLPVDGPALPEVRVGSVRAAVVRAASRAIDVVIPPGLDGGRQAVQVDTVAGEPAFVEIGTRVATGLHQVDSPAIGPDGSVYVTYSGSRDEQAPVSIYRVTPAGTSEPFSNLANPTSLAWGPDGGLYVSSRFEGVVYRMMPGGSPVVFASNLGVPFGLVFDGETLFVGDRTGSIHRVSASGAVPFASLPPSVAACHLALGTDRCLYATAPTLAPRDSVYRIDDAGGAVEVCGRFGRPQGLAFDRLGRLHVVEALAGSSAVYRVDPDGRRRAVVAGRDLIGLAFDAHGGLVVTSSETLFGFPGDALEAA